MSLMLDYHRQLYQTAVAWIALNDGPGDSDAHKVSHVAGTVTVLLVADLFGYKPETVARAVVKYRKEHFDGC
jgi:hypothetical protein